MLMIISILGRKIIKEKTIASTAFVHFVLLKSQNLTVLSSFNTGGEFFLVILREGKLCRYQHYPMSYCHPWEIERLCIHHRYNRLFYSVGTKKQA